MTPKPTPVRVLDPANTEVVLFGVGGTGGYCLQQLCRLLYGLKAERLEGRVAPPLHRQREEPEAVPEILLCDGDTVSAGNLLRQYFLPRDVGKKKALVLAERYGAAYGLKIAAHAEYLAPHTDLKALVPEGAIVVGSVDNAATRALLHEKLSAYRDVVYVDSGNAGVEPPPDEGLSRRDRVRVRDSGWEGQVLCGVRKGGETVVPFPAEQIPDLIEDDGEPLPSEVPCGQLVVSNPQRHLTNLLAATVLSSFLTTLVSDGTLLHRMSLFCARRGYIKSYPAIDELDEVAV